MNKPKLLLTLLGVAAAFGADAQQLYKSVGTDGKVTFSDRAPTGDGKVSVMRSNILRPLEPKEPVASLAGALPKAGVIPAARPLAPVRTPATPELEEAVSALLLQVELSKKFEPLCSPTLLAGRDYNLAVYNWRKRNALFLQQQNRILMEVIDPIKRAAIYRKVEISVDASLLETIALNAAGRAKWCERAILEMNSGISDVEKNTAVAAPLTAYKFN